MFNFATYDFSKTKDREISQHKTLLLKSLALFCKIQIIPNTVISCKVGSYGLFYNRLITEKNWKKQNCFFLVITDKIYIHTVIHAWVFVYAHKN